MVNNGFIVFITETGGGRNNYGDLIPVSDVFSDPYPCNLNRASHRLEYFDNGQYKQTSYISIFEKTKEITTISSNVKKIQLIDSQNNVLGVFQIQNLEYLTITNKIKIVV